MSYSPPLGPPRPPPAGSQGPHHAPDRYCHPCRYYRGRGTGRRAVHCANLTGRHALTAIVSAHPVSRGIAKTVTAVVIASSVASCTSGRGAAEQPSSGLQNPPTSNPTATIHTSATATHPQSARPSTGRPRPTSAGPSAQPASPGNALAVLATLPVKGRAPMTGYSREQFGQAWSDDVNVPDGHNGCDTRNDILRRDLTSITFKPNTSGCVVARGTLKRADSFRSRGVVIVGDDLDGTAIHAALGIDVIRRQLRGFRDRGSRNRRFLSNHPDLDRLFAG